MIMTTTAIALLSLAAVVLLMQGVVVLRYAFMLRAAPRPTPPDDQLPKAAVVLSLRGVDPYFADSLATLLDQNYPRYDVHIVVDNQQDEAWQAIEAARSGDVHGRMHVQVLANPGSTCSLKNSALIQVVQSLDDSYEALAFFDGDAAPHRDWLRDMVAPLAELGVGAATGNRWYCPRQTHCGSLVRYVWNIGAVVQMWMNRIVWAGSMAITAEAIRESRLLDVWRRSMSTDSVVLSQLRKAGYSVAVVPEAIMVNREEISLSQFVRWLGRQMLMVRLYHPGWLLVVLQTLFIAVLQLAAAALMLSSAVTQHWWPGLIAASALALYWGTSCVFVWVVDRATIVRLARRRESVEPLALANLPRLMLAMILANIAFPWAMLSAMTRREVEWRGIKYHVKGPFQVEMARYLPYQSNANDLPHGSVM
jgi:cellulose synthase/poly-beta-1,6-N-acetylglucosamine synthase-like glycosyltransferase